MKQQRTRNIVDADFRNVVGNLMYAQSRYKLGCRDYLNGRAYQAYLARKARRLKKELKTAPLPVNERGNTVERSFMLGDGYRLVADYVEQRGFRLHVDTGYLMVMSHAEHRMTVTYCEGDITIVRCPTDAAFDAELADARAFYERHGDDWEY